MRKLRDEITRVKEGKERVGELMQGLVGRADGEDASGVTGGRAREMRTDGGKDGWRERQRGAWAAIDGKAGGDEGDE